MAPPSRTNVLKLTDFSVILLMVCYRGILCNIQEEIRTGKFENPKEGHVLVGHAIATHFLESRIDCAFECQGHSRCVSYNYKGGNASRNLCELNDQTRVTRPRDYQSRPGFTYYEAAVKEISPFTVSFPKTKTDDCIKTTLPQSLTEFTICFWLKCRVCDFHVYTYATQTYLRALALKMGCPITKFRLFLNDVRPENVPYMPPLFNAKWHHICHTWETNNGTLKIYLDGVLKQLKGGFAVGQVVQGGGVFVIGQKQDMLGGGFNHKHTFAGSLNSFNVWNKEFDGHVVTRMFVDCDVENKAVLSWADMRKLIGGNLAVVDESPCSSKQGDSTSDFQLEFPLKSSRIANYAVYRSIPKLEKFTICVWFKADDVKGTLFSYVTSKLFSPMVAAFNSGSLILSVSNEDWVNVQLPYTLKNWHHVCFMWHSERNGSLVTSFDGKNMGEKVGCHAGNSIPANGEFVIGQEQDSSGTITGVRPFYGRISHLNVWTQILPFDSVQTMYFGCESTEGNGLAWSVFRSNRKGRVLLSEPSECSLPTYTVQQKRDKACNDTFTSTSTCASPLIALFDGSKGTPGKLWQCYYSNAIREEVDSPFFILEYDSQSNCTRSMTAELLAIVN